MNEIITWLENIENMILDLNQLLEATKIYGIVLFIMVAALLFCVVALIFNVYRVNRRIDEVFDLIDNQKGDKNGKYME